MCRHSYTIWWGWVLMQVEEQVMLRVEDEHLKFLHAGRLTSPLYYSSLAGVVGGAEVVQLRGVRPRSHPLTESSKRGPGRARPRLSAEFALSVGGV